MKKLVLLVWLAGTCLLAQTREDKVRNDKQKIEAGGYWIYNDLPKAFAEAKSTGKPMIVVLRCVPCEECVKLDDEIIDADERVKSLLEKFVRVRVVSTNGLDLSLFQYDTDQSFAVFFLNADGTIYGRFGTRSHRTNWVGDVSVDGMAKAMKGALALHESFSVVRDSLQAKRGPKPMFAQPELFPSLKSKYTSTLDYKGKVAQSCIHCHQIGDAIRETYLLRNEKIPETTLFPYPHPKSIGLILDPKEMAQLIAVEPGSPAEKAGVKAGDSFLKMAGQPILSIADVQWVLHNSAPEGAEIKIEFARAGKTGVATLSLGSGWRRKDDIGWRASTWGLRRKATGGIFAPAPTPEERMAIKVPEGKMALKVQHVGQFAPHDVALKAGVRKGDILIGFDGRDDLLRETDLIAYSLYEKKSGDKIQIDVLREGKKMSFTMPRP